MTANGIKVLEAMAKLEEITPITSFWWSSDEIAEAAVLNPKGIGAILSGLYYRDECVRREYRNVDRRFIYQINEKGLEIARAA